MRNGCVMNCGISASRSTARGEQISIFGGWFAVGVALLAIAVDGSGMGLSVVGRLPTGVRTDEALSKGVGLSAVRLRGAAGVQEEKAISRLIPSKYALRRAVTRRL
jgi:hypothetical protein